MNKNEFADFLRDVLRDEIDAFQLPRYLTSKQAASVAGVTPPTIRTWAKRGDLRSYWAGGDLRVRLSDLEAYLARRNPDNLIDLEARVREMMS